MSSWPHPLLCLCSITRSGLSLHLNLIQGVGCCSLKATDGMLGPWKDIFTPDAVLEKRGFLNQTFLEGKDILNLFVKRPAAMFQLVPSSATFCIFSPF